MIWTNGAGASTGMFVPALAVGATGGRMAGRIVKAIVRYACAVSRLAAQCRTRQHSAHAFDAVEARTSLISLACVEPRPDVEASMSGSCNF